MEDQLDPFLVTPNTIWPVATILEMTISGTVRLIKFAFGSGVGFFRVGRSNGAISGSIKYYMAAMT